jgi:hypothetical protein
MHLGTHSFDWRPKNQAYIVKTTDLKPHTEDGLSVVKILKVCATKIYCFRAPDDWFLDRRANAYVTGNKHLLTNVNQDRPPPSGRYLPVVAQGTVVLDNKFVGHVLYVPSMYKNLFFIRKFADEGHFTPFGPQQCWVFLPNNPHKVLLIGFRSLNNNSHYQMLYLGNVMPLFDFQSNLQALVHNK